ncbi:MAG TPA: hypothetical protein VGE99_04330 [Candidatus Dormibacteraeota bacterium]
MTTGSLGWIGVWLLVAGAVAILLESVVAVLLGVRVARRARVLSARLTAGQAELRSAVERLNASLAEMQVLWQPYRRLLRWLRHPLTIALMQSFARRRTAAR